MFGDHHSQLPTLLRPEEAAKELSISRAKLYQLIAAGVIPSLLIGHSRRVPKDALARWIDEQLAVQAGHQQ